MNSVERIVYYATEIEQEAPHELRDNKPPAGWPAHGRVELKNIFLSYRPGLPSVLKGLNMTVEAGEKIGIVGRYDPPTISSTDVELTIGPERERVQS
jgi:ABC-type multidrug transport system fused ATPase/permease subunit